jgi:hypothetical protein
MGGSNGLSVDSGAPLGARPVDQEEAKGMPPPGFVNLGCKPLARHGNPGDALGAAGAGGRLICQVAREKAALHHP